MPKPVDTLDKKLFPDENQFPPPEFRITKRQCLGLWMALGAVTVANWVQPVVDLWKPADHTQTINLEVACPVGETPAVNRSTAPSGVVYGKELVTYPADGTRQTSRMPYIAIGCVGPDGETIFDGASSMRLARDSDGSRSPVAPAGQSISTMSLVVGFHGRTLPGEMPDFTPVSGATSAGASYQDASAVKQVLVDQDMIRGVEVLSTAVQSKPE